MATFVSKFAVKNVQKSPIWSHCFETKRELGSVGGGSG